MVANLTGKDPFPLEGTVRGIKHRKRHRETLDAPITRVTPVTDAAVRCHRWCPIRHRWGMIRDEARLVGILIGAQAEAAKPRALVVIPVFHAVKA
jgi:hypothetical protein